MSVKTSSTDYRTVELPKWPAMVVVGDPVSPRLAAEIIVRTDSHLPDFRYAGNSRSLGNRLCQLFGVPLELPKDDYAKHFERLDKLRDALNKVDLNYLSNDQIVSSWVGGPHGWVNWSGSVFSNNYNIGKWPTTEEVFLDWKNIAQAFPSLSLLCWLYSNEVGEGGRALVRYQVAGGNVEAFAQQDGDPLPSTNPHSDVSEWVTRIVSQPAEIRESGISPDSLKERLLEIYGGSIPQF